MIKIGIDFHSAEREGTGNCTYIRNLVEKLTVLDTKNKYFLYVTNLKYSYYEKFWGRTNIRFRLMRPKNPLIRIPFVLGPLSYIDNIDILHTQYIAPPFHSGKLLITIHDLAHFRYPECFGKFERIRSKILIPLNAKKADGIVTVSNYSKQDIIRALHIPSKKIEITHDGANENFKPIEDNEAIVNTLRSYGIKGNYILSVGRLDPRKNLIRLIKAFSKLKKEMKISHKLIIVGSKEYLFSDSEIERVSSKFKRDIIMTGYVPTALLPVFYSSADVLVYPTLFEGFGLPCLEAMKCGCPVVSSNTSSIPEVVGDAGILINPTDIFDISAAIYKVINDPKLRSEMRRKGLQRAKSFSWDETARRTLEIYNKILYEQKN